MGFVGNYAPRGLSPQTDGMPVIQKQAPPHTRCLLLFLCLPLAPAFIREALGPWEQILNLFPGRITLGLLEFLKNILEILIWLQIVCSSCLCYAVHYCTGLSPFG